MRWLRQGTSVWCVLAVAVLSLSRAEAATAQLSQWALRFYGTGSGQQDRVRIVIDDDAPGPDASAPCDVGAGSFTVELWLRGRLSDNATSNGGGDREWSDNRWIDGNIIVDRDIWNGSQRDWGISIAGGVVRFGTGYDEVAGVDGEATIEGSSIVLDDTWHHLAAARDQASGRMSIYVDGLLDFESSPGLSVDDISYPDDGAPGQVTVWGPYVVIAAEKHDAGAAYPSFNGFVDEVRFWNRAWSAQDAATLPFQLVATDAPGLVGYYRFEEGAGTTVSDSSDAGCTDGELIAGSPGNGEWVSSAADPANTAPVVSAVIFVDGFETGTSNWSQVVE